jgi:hypothetical protein
MKAKFHMVERNADEPLELSEDWIPVRPGHNEYTMSRQKAHTLYVLARG